MHFYFEMSQNINSMMRHLKSGYTSIFTNLLRTVNETKSAEIIYN